MESNKYRISIELGIAPICESLNQIPDVKTIWSREGHPKTRIARTLYLLHNMPNSYQKIDVMFA